MNVSGNLFIFERLNKTQNMM